jgi:hypothetical protein
MTILGSVGFAKEAKRRPFPLKHSSADLGRLFSKVNGTFANFDDSPDFQVADGRDKGR